MRWVLCLVMLSAGCGDDGGTPDTGGTDSGGSDAGVDSGGGDAATDAGPTGPTCTGLAMDPPVVACTPLPTDYSPGAMDMWPACISDDDEYHRIGMSISTIARVIAHEEIATLLFDPTSDPTMDDFLMARTIYQRDEGLDSRMVRRYDPHVTVPMGTDCTLPAIPAMYPDYCVGPAHLQPIILDAFSMGIAGGPGPSRLHAARIEAAFLWFFYVSTYKEGLTCTTVPADCDSAYAYYAGGEAARGGIGLAADVEAVDPEAHDRAWDGLLAVRCWRDLDPMTPATMIDVRERARNQYDRAVLDGVAAIVRDRLVQVCGTSGDERAYHWELARTLGPVLLREAMVRSAGDATTLQTELQRTDLDDVNVTAVVDAIDAVFDCP